VTRDKWLLPLLYELGWGHPEPVTGGLDVPAGLGETTAPHFPISHRLTWSDGGTPTGWVPLHLVGGGVALDTKTASVTARAPQSMLQDYLNREDRSLWAVLSNGRTLRLLRDASTLARQSYVEFDPRRHLHQPALRRLPPPLPHRTHQPIPPAARRQHEETHP